LKTLNSNYLRVLEHRIKNSDLPKFNHLLKIKDHIPKNKLEQYIEKAKNKYDTLLIQYPNDTKDKHTTTSTKR